MSSLRLYYYPIGKLQIFMVIFPAMIWRVRSLLCFQLLNLKHSFTFSGENLGQYVIVRRIKLWSFPWVSLESFFSLEIITDWIRIKQFDFCINPQFYLQIFKKKRSKYKECTKGFPSNKNLMTLSLTSQVRNRHFPTPFNKNKLRIVNRKASN